MMKKKMEKMLPKNLVNYIIEVKDGFDPFENSVGVENMNNHILHLPNYGFQRNS